MFIKDFVKQNAVLTYFALTFFISWSGFILVIGGPSGFPGTQEEMDRLMTLVALVMLTGPSISSIFMTSFIYGRSSIRELLSQLLRWRVGAGWYAIAILPTPILAATALFVLSLDSELVAADNKVIFLLIGIIVGLTVVFEEIGWTGFAVPELRKNYSIFTTGIIVGVVWGAWHFLQSVWISGTYSGDLDPAIFILMNTIAGITQLTAYRILLVWVYDRTRSLLVVTLMHASLTSSTIFIFRPLATVTGVSFLADIWIVAILMWVFLAVVVVINRRQFSRQIDHPST